MEVTGEENSIAYEDLRIVTFGQKHMGVGPFWELVLFGVNWTKWNLTLIWPLIWNNGQKESLKPYEDSIIVIFGQKCMGIDTFWELIQNGQNEIWPLFSACNFMRIRENVPVIILHNFRTSFPLKIYRKKTGKFFQITKIWC